MFAKLTTRVSANVSANVFYSSLIDVITGTITANTQLNVTTFDQSLSYIISAVSTNWTVVDAQANTPGNTYVLSGAPPKVIASPWSDSSSFSKYLWLSPRSSVNTNFDIAAIPMLGWNSTTKTPNSMLVANLAVFQANNTTFPGNNVSGLRNFYDLVSQMSNTFTTTGTTTIVSASNTHLFVASYKGTGSPVFNNYLYLTEYTRDDPWNTVANEYPSWLIEGASNSTGIFALSNVQSQAHDGGLARILNSQTGADVDWVKMNEFAVGSPQLSSDWGIASRLVPYGASRTYAGTGGLSTVFIPRGLAAAGTSQLFLGNYNIARTPDKQISSAISEIRVMPANQGRVINSNTMFAGGSISTISPYIYLFRSQYPSLDEVQYAGNTYMNLILNTGIAGQTNASCILVREV